MSPCWVMSSTVLRGSSNRNNNRSSSNSNKISNHQRQFSTHSERGKRAVSLLPEYLADARAVTQYCPKTAPDGALQLGVAENQMLEDLLVPALSEYASTATSAESPCFAADLIYYQPTHGRPALRQAFCAYLERILSLPDDSMDPEGIVMGTGCNAVLENLCITLAEPGEGVMIPTPYYAAFEFDLVARAGLSILPVNTFQHSGVPIPPIVTVIDNGDNDDDDDDDSSTDDDDDSSTDTTTQTTTSSTTTTNNNNNKNNIPIEAYYPTKAGLTATLQAAREEGESPRILLISHPNNPLGISYPPKVVQDCIDWCRDNKIHLISDEIYAGSIHATDNDNNFVSALSLGKATTQLGDYIHFVYSLSKDFALSGLRVGAVYSENKDIRMPLQKLNDLCQISSQTQVLVERMVTAKTNNSNNNNNNNNNDDDDDMFWTTDLLKQNNNRIRARCNALQAVLDEFQVAHLKATSGLFCWMDMSKYLTPLNMDHDNLFMTTCGDNQETLQSMQKRERALYLELMNDFGLLFTPGMSMKNERPGFFRCVFTAASDHEFALALDRLRTFCQAKQQKQD